MTYDLETLKVVHPLTDFNGQRHCGSGDDIFMIYHVISQKHLERNHVTLWVVANQGKSPSCKFWWP